MGSYCSLYVAGIDLGSTKNDIDPAVMLLLAPCLRTELGRPTDCRTPEYAKYYRLPGPTDRWTATEQTQVIYRTAAGVVRERLDLLGFSLATTRQAFELAVARKLQSLKRYASSDHGVHWNESIGVHESLNPDSWL